MIIHIDMLHKFMINIWCILFLEVRLCDSINLFSMLTFKDKKKYYARALVVGFIVVKDANLVYILNIFIVQKFNILGK